MPNETEQNMLPPLDAVLTPDEAARWPVKPGQCERIDVDGETSFLVWVRSDDELHPRCYYELRSGIVLRLSGLDSVGCVPIGSGNYDDVISRDRFFWAVVMGNFDKVAAHVRERRA